MPSRKNPKSRKTKQVSSTVNEPRANERQQTKRGSQIKRQGKPRQLRCDCGKLAVTVVTVKVGTDPQYTMRMPLCDECLALEKSLH